MIPFFIFTHFALLIDLNKNIEYPESPAIENSEAFPETNEKTCSNGDIGKC